MIKQGEKKRYGFTLIELSIVLVIVALVAGGVVGGHSLVRASYVVATHTQLKQLQTMMNTFRTQYDALPGDFREADQYWSGTVSGDGDSLIEIPNNGANPPEHFMLWEHLSLAEIAAPGIDAGQHTSGSVQWSVINIPPTPFEGVYISAVSHCIKLVSSCTPEWRDSLVVGRYTGSDEGSYRLAAFPPEFAQRLDKKGDDGVPRSGKIIGANGTVNEDCVTTAGARFLASGALYDLTQDTDQCIIYFSF